MDQMFIDEVEIYVKAGKGGDGAVSFRREKYVPKGGPDGGDGGRGGAVIFKVNPQSHGLAVFNREKRFLAQDGQNGARAKKSGRSGNDLVLPVPTGTEIYEKDQLIADLIAPDQTIILVKGGRGGWGNQHFATSIKQAPKWAKEGEKGESKKLRLILKTIADVGIIGLPNAGKSTLLSVLTDAKPKIADYPFTTLEPNLGTHITPESRIIFADIPGLIEGASAGRGLGFKFLQHVERTKIILHLIDASSKDPLSDYKTIRLELKKFSQELFEKKEIVALNKIELIDAVKLRKITKSFTKEGLTALAISAGTTQGIDDLINKIKVSL